VAEILTARFDLPADFRAAGRARRILTELLTAWGRHEDAEVARLLVSEIVTNAVRHAGQGRPLELHVTADHLRVRVAVGDGSARRPVPRTPRDDDETGRGMHLVQTLASEWGVDARVEYGAGEGKQVWFELPSPAGRSGARAHTRGGSQPATGTRVEAGKGLAGRTGGCVGDGRFADTGVAGSAGNPGPPPGDGRAVPAGVGSSTGTPKIAASPETGAPEGANTAGTPR
jgi:anti-sigma regulatory factor (Ser/Thr protein kinase)